MSLAIHLSAARFTSKDGQIPPFHGCHLYSRKKGVCPVTECSWLLRVNSAVDNHSAQSSWRWSTYAQRYTLISWFTCLVCPSVCGWNAVLRFTLTPTMAY